MGFVKRRSDAEVRAATRRARAGFPAEYALPGSDRLPAAVRRDSIVSTHSLIPPAMEAAFGALKAYFDPSLPLTRRQHETIATIVSALNDCFY